MSSAVRVFFELSYDGTAFHGWQRQPQSISVQQVIEESIARLTGQSTAVVGCGRTDAGVHASYFVAHAQFQENPTGTEKLPSWAHLVHKLNGMLPDSIAIHAAGPVGDRAHARFSAVERSYTYWMHTAKDPFLVGRSARIYRDLDVPAMQDSTRHLIRKGDFAAFCKAGSGSSTTICDVRRCELVVVSPSVLRFEITADRFLRNMVRAVVGTVLEVGYGRREAKGMEEVIASCNRSEAGKSAPADGLFLSHVGYPQEIWKRSVPEVVGAAYL